MHGLCQWGGIATVCVVAVLVRIKTRTKPSPIIAVPSFETIGTPLQQNAAIAGRRERARVILGSECRLGLPPLRESYALSRNAWARQAGDVASYCKACACQRS